MTNYKKPSFFLFFILVSINTHSFPLECTTDKGIETCRVSIIQLIATPEKYHGKLVYVTGFYVDSYEISALFLSKHDADLLLTSNAIWVEYTGKEEPQCLEQEGYTWICENLANVEEASGKYVDIFGKFNMNNQGHLASYKGAIENVEHFTLLHNN